MLRRSRTIQSLKVSTGRIYTLVCPDSANLNISNVNLEIAPLDLHLPQFVYSELKASSSSEFRNSIGNDPSRSTSQAFAFSAFFQSSAASSEISILRPSPASSTYFHSSLSSSTTASNFIGFSWGPTVDAFPSSQPPITETDRLQAAVQSTPSLFLRTPRYPQSTPIPASRTKSLAVPLTWGPGALSTPTPLRGYRTPMKPYADSPHATLPRTNTIRRTAPRRMVSDREAMKQLVDCVGMSARKKVLESGKKPKFLALVGQKSGSTNGTGKSSGTSRKELRFDKFSFPISGPDYSAANTTQDRSKPRSRSNSLSRSLSRILAASNSGGPLQSMASDSQHLSTSLSFPHVEKETSDDDQSSAADTETSDSEAGGHPPSPSPSPRPGSAMSIMSMTMMSRRSVTPSGYLNVLGAGSLRRTRSNSGSGFSALVETGAGTSSSEDRSITATITINSTNATTATTASEYLTGPSTTAADKVALALDPEPTRNQEGGVLIETSTQPAQNHNPSPPSLSTIHRGVEKKSLPRGNQEYRSPVSDAWLDGLENRHVAMMKSISALEQKLDELGPLLHNS